MSGRPGNDRPAVEELMALAVAAARAAGAVLEGFSRDALDVTRKGAAGDLVTAADTAAEAEVRAVLRRARPDDGVLGEEDGLERGRSGLTWVVDPLDGTTNYVRGIAYWGTSVAVRRDADGAILAGAIHAPALGRTYRAGAGLGAWLDRGDGTSVPLRRGGAGDDAPALLGTGFSYDAERRAAQAAAMTGLLDVVVDVRRLGAAALDLCAVADGALDAYAESDLREHDFAAGALIAAEAGARVSGRRPGTPPSEDLVLAARPDLYDLLVPRCGAL
ncbi:MAG TPA: inositol monophosphatase family protein [Baekduia sp.]|nr:inositol monophosphatase family protein [Baekduia sp.]